MVSKRKIGICLIVIVILSTVVIGCILSSYNNPDFFWGYFAIGEDSGRERKYDSQY